MEWLIDSVESGGYVGIAVLMFVEGIFPPIPSEVIMPVAGFAVARGDLNGPLVVLAGSAGSLASALFWYGVGRWIGRDQLSRWTERHGRWLTLTPHDIDQACRWFNRHGGKTVLGGRLVPGVRMLISLPAGIAAMPLPKVLIYVAIGTVLWTGFLTGVGYLLAERFGRVGDVMTPLTHGVLGLLLAGYIYRVLTFRKRLRR